MPTAVIASAVRSAVARSPGALADVPLEEFGGAVVRAALERAHVAPGEVGDVVWGNVMAGGGNVGRRTALSAGLPVEVPAMTVDRQCGSGLQAICLAEEAVRTGRCRVALGGGSESMTRAPYLMERPVAAHQRTPPRFFRPRLATEKTGDPAMGETAENVARRWGVDRLAQDAFALRSQERAGAAIRAGRFAAEIVPIEVSGPGGERRLFAEDEHPRAGLTLERLLALPPAFVPGGSVTAGNSSGINDGAGAAVLMEAGEAERRGVRPLGRLLAWHVAGVEPALMGMGPVPATRGLLARTGLALQDIDLVELNEAFASQAVACIRELGLDEERVNVLGGAIALGHPIAATGAILVANLLHELDRRGGRYGLVTACIGGGQGIAALFEAGPRAS